MLDYVRLIELGNLLDDGKKFNILLKLVLDIRFILLLGLLLVCDPKLYYVNMLVPGDGLYEERMKTEGRENEWNAQENEKPLEQDIAMGDVDAVIA